MKRTKFYLLKLTEEEQTQFKEESSKLGISMASFIRLLVRRWVKMNKDKNNGQEVI